MSSASEFDLVLSNQSDTWFQISVIQFLQKLGFEWVPENELMGGRSANLGEVLLEETLREQLAQINQFEIGAQSRAGSKRKIDEAVRSIRSMASSGRCGASQKVLNSLLGRRAQPFVKNRRARAGSLEFIDWENPSNNTFHVAVQAECRRESDEGSRWEIVCFVNGIPLALIDCSRQQTALGFVGNVGSKEGAEWDRSNGFLQLLVALDRDRGRYTCVSDGSDAWQRWTMNGEAPSSLLKLVRLPPREDHLETLFNGRFAFARADFEQLVRPGAEVLNFERFLWEFFYPTHFLALISKFIFQNETVRIRAVARRCEVLAVGKTLKRIGRRGKTKKEEGGFLWLPIGERKALLLGFVVNALLRDGFLSQRRRLLLCQGEREFNGTSAVFRQIRKGTDALRSGSAFSASVKDHCVLGASLELLIAVLESDAAMCDRFAGWEWFVLISFCPTSMTIDQVEALERLLPKQCFLFISDQAPTRAWKRVMRRFGGMIDSDYTYSGAVAEEALVPSYYETRLLGGDISEEKGTTFDAASGWDRDPECLKSVALDVSRDCCSGAVRGFGGSLVVVATNAEAFMLKAYFDEIGVVECCLALEPEIEGGAIEWSHADNWALETPKVDAGRRSDFPMEVRIVSSEQIEDLEFSRIRVLYLAARPLAPKLLRLISAVNQPCYGKDRSLVVEYLSIRESAVGIRCFVDTLARVYGRSCVIGLCRDLQKEVISLPSRIKVIRGSISGKQRDSRNICATKDLTDSFCRARFRQMFFQFHRYLSLVSVSRYWREEIPISEKEFYAQALIEFQNLRVVLRVRFSEAPDCLEFEPQLRRLIELVGAGKPSLEMPENLDLMDRRAFEVFLSRMPSSRARVDMIAHWMLRELSDRSVGTPHLYRRVETQLIPWIERVRRRPLLEGSHMACLAWALGQFQILKVPGATSTQRGWFDSAFLRNVVNRTLGPKFQAEEEREALALSEVGNTYRIDAETQPSSNPMISLLADQLGTIAVQSRDLRWGENLDVQNRLRNDLDDYLLEFQLREQVRFSLEEMDVLIDAALKSLY